MSKPNISSRSGLVALLLLALAVFGWVHFDTLSSIVAKWSEDVAYRHGYLIVPLSAWLVWRMRSRLVDVHFQPSWVGVGVLFGLSVLWLVSRAVGVQVIEQLSAVAMIPALVLAVLGVTAARTLAFPLGFLLFAVPFGQGLLPLMMQVTADVSTWALHLTGIPVYRSHMYLTIPYGKFEIAKACGGLKYVITGLVLGALYTYLTYRTWWKRVLSMLVFLVVPILANALRVYVIVVVSYLTEFRFGPGAEHVEFGRVLFILVMVALFWIGRRWAEDEVPAGDSAIRPAATGRTPESSGFVPALVAMMVVALGPIYLHSASRSAVARSSSGSVPAVLPDNLPGWSGPRAEPNVWKPVYSGGLMTASGVYSNPAGEEVDVFVSVYGLGTTHGNEMIAYDNVLSSREHASLVEDRRLDVSAGPGRGFQVREVVIQDERGAFLVWQWFMVGHRPATDSFLVKGMEAVAFLARSADDERIVTLATPLDAGSRGRLQSFLSAHEDCVMSGFAGEACRP
jgi:exosortase A